jgi:hypothetical protein
MRLLLALLLALAAPLLAAPPLVKPDGRATLVHFANAECSCCVRAATQVDRLRRLYGDKARFVLVIDLDAAGAAKWQRIAGMDFEASPDPDRALIRRAGVERGLTSILLGPDGKEVRRWQGHSAGLLGDIAEAVALVSGSAPRALPVEGVPKELVSGCTFPR